MAKRRPTSKPHQLKPSHLRWKCPSAWISGPRAAGATEDPLPGLIGQERALEAIEMGLAVEGAGYNVFVSGISGTERTETVRRILERMRLERENVHDHVFVHNFADPMRPQHLALPPGMGKQLRKAMEDWVRALRRQIPGLLDSEEHNRLRQQLFHRYTQMEQTLFDRLKKRASSSGLALVKKTGDEGTQFDLFFKIGDESVDPEDLASIPEKDRPKEAEMRRLLARRQVLQNNLRRVLKKARGLALRMLRESQALDQAAVREAVEALTLETAEEIEADLELAAWLGDCARHAIQNPELFHRGGAPEGEGLDEEEQEEDGKTPARRRPGLEVFEVNLVRAAPPEGCPAVHEVHPTYSNLFGTVERHVTAMGSGFYHLAVQPGTLLEADGGFLVLNARDVFKEAEVWRALKRTLQSNRLETHALEALSPLGVTGVRPEAVPIDLKVVLIGDNPLYEQLHEADLEFPMIFKVKAEFDDSLPLTRDNVKRFVRVVRDLALRDRLVPFAKSGLQALVERAVRDSGRRNRLSARISSLVDYAREASFFARRAGKRRVDAEAVEVARRNFRRQHSLDAEWFTRMVIENVYEIATSGERVGSLNAMTVVSLGPLSFGRPARVSAVASPGEDTYTIIEREVELSGPIHSKGALILESFMRHRFATRRTLPIKVSLVFDQSYGPIDGDSASSTEVYALLSALSGVPLRQDIAVTGAVNMNGEVMAVGGVNEKIEGFFEVCSTRGLTGEQGCVIPATNLGDLMLSSEVVAAVRAGSFHIWSIEHVDQGIALLTGLPAGRPSADGSYPPDSVMGRVGAQIARFEEIIKDKDKDEKKGGKGRKSAAAKAAARAPSVRRG